uniref:PH domain-containing protein n=1 Tax=Globodera pallida TaxID=36090 RepID=A0A183BTB9_GLOPA
MPKASKNKDPNMPKRAQSAMLANREKIKKPGMSVAESHLHTQADVTTILSGASSGGSSTLLVESASQKHFYHHLKSNTTNSANEQLHLRRFTSAVGKPGQARETREAISKVLSSTNPSRSPPIAEPLDYEHFVGENSALLEHDKDRDLLLFLRDDISGVEVWPRERTAVPSVRQRDIDEAQWLLAMDAIRHYSSPYTVIQFNYSRFCGELKRFDSPQGLNFLRFECDLIADEEKLTMSGQCSVFAAQSDILKEGNLVIVPGDGIVDSFRSEKKRYCVLRKSADESRVYIEVYKQALAQQQLPTMEMDVKSASIKSTKKGKLLQLSSTESDKRALLFSAESETDLQFWLFSIERALNWNNRETMLASEEDNVSLNSSGRENSLPLGSCSMHDSESLASEDSGAIRDFSSGFWRSRNAAARALQPPIVERRNLFSLYWDMEPLPEPEGGNSTLGEQLSETEQCNAERSSPIPSSISTAINPLNRPKFGGKRTAPQAPPVEELQNGMLRDDFSQCSEPSTSEFAGEKPAILFTAQLRHLDIRIRLAGKEHSEQIEPFFARAFLYDAGLGTRISEEFHVDFPLPLQHGEVLCQNGHSGAKFSDFSFPSSFSIADSLNAEKVNGISWVQIRNANKLICSIHNPRPDLFLIVLVERVLSDVPVDIYLKTNNSIDAKNSPVFPSLCLNGAFASQQQNGISASENGGTVDGVGKKSSLATCSLYKCESGRLTDGDLQKLLTEMQKADKMTKLVAFPNAALVLETDVTSVLCEFPMRISPSYLPLRPWKRPTFSPNKPPILPSFELQSFLDQSLNSEPHRGRVNLLYVYPISLNYSTQKTFSRARNISCTVRYVPSSAIKTAQIDKNDLSGANIFNRTNLNGPFVDSFVCDVQYHEQSPQFNTEVKMELPVALDENDHILFTFHHISISSAVANKNKPFVEHIETPVGYAWLPLVRKDSRGLSQLIMSEKCQEFELPVAANLSSKYHEFKPTFACGLKEISPNLDIKFVENGRPLFRARLRLVSSVFTTEERLQNFFQLCQQLYPNVAQMNKMPSVQMSNSSSDLNFKQATNLKFHGNNTSKNGCSASDIQDHSLSPTHFAIEHNLVESIEKLTSIDLDQLIPFFEIVLNRLFSLLTFSKAEDVMLSALGAIICLADQLFMHRKSKRDILRNYVRLYFKCQNQLLKCDAEESTHGAICKCIPLLVHRAQSTKEGTMILELFHTLTERIIFMQKECPLESRMANAALGNFIKHCLSLMDRHQIMKELYAVVKKMDVIESKSFRIYKFELLQLLVGHEHWVPLCLPLLTDKFGIVMRGDNFRIEGPPAQAQQQTAKNGGGTGLLAKLFSQIFSPFHGIISESNEVEKFSLYSEHFYMSATYCSMHFPIGLLLQELMASLRDSRDYRRKVIRLVRNLLAKHSQDERYGDTSARSRIAMLTMPLLRLAIENIREIEVASTSTSVDSPNHSPMPITDCQSRLSMLTITPEWGRCQMESRDLSTTQPSSRLSTITMPTMNNTNGTISTDNNNARPTSNGPNGTAVVAVLVEKLDKSEVRDLMLSVLYTLNGLPKKMLAAFWNAQESIQPSKTLPNSEDSSEELSKQQQQHQNVLVDFVRLLELALLLFRYRGRSHHIILQAKSSKFSTLTDVTFGDTYDSKGMADEESKDAEATSFLMDCNLAQEVALIVLETVQTIANQIAAKTRYSTSGNFDAVFLRLLHLQLELLSESWPEAVRLHTLSALAVFVNLVRCANFA